MLTVSQNTHIVTKSGNSFQNNIPENKKDFIKIHKSMIYLKHFLIGISLLTVFSTVFILKEIKQTREIDELTTTNEMMKNFRKQGKKH